MLFFKKKLSDAELASAVKAEAQKYFGSKQGSHDWDHSLRVLNNCRLIGPQMGANMTILELAAYLHDIGRGKETANKGKVCHAKIGAWEAERILKKLGAGKELTQAVVHCIECHRSKDDQIPQSIEAKVLFDADKLDALGAVGLVRLFLFANEVGAGIHNKESDLSKTNAYSDEDTAFREFYLSNRFLKDKMITDTGKKLAAARYDFMIEFFEHLFEEVSAHPDFFLMLDEIKGAPEASAEISGQ